MKRSKFLILISSVLILLIVVALLTQKKDAHPDLATTDATTVTTPLITYEINQIKQLEVSDENNALIFVPNENDWQTVGYNLPLDSSIVKYYCNSLLTLDTTNTLPSTDLSEFGLDTPTKQLTYTLTDNTSKTLLFGDNTVDNLNTYVCFKDTNTIYTISSTIANSFKTDINAFRPRELANIDSSLITTLKVSGKTIDTFDITYRSSAENTEHTTYALSVNNSEVSDIDISAYSALLELLPTTIKVEKFIADDSTDFSNYGLDTPTLDLFIETTETVEVQNDNSKIDTTTSSPDSSPATTSEESILQTNTFVTTYHYLFGNETIEGQTYFMDANGTSIYTIDNTFLEPLLDALDEFNLSSKLTSLTNIASINGLTFNVNSETYDFKINRGSQTPTTYTLNNKTIEEDPFKVIYRNIIGIVADTELSSTEIPTTELPAVSITFYYTDGSQQQLNYYSYDNQFYLTSLNGHMNVGCNIKQFNHIKELIKDELAN